MRICWFVAAVLAIASPASATWTIVAVDTDTGEVGSAGASCTPFVVGVARLVPGRGAIVAQAMSNMNAKAKGVSMIEIGQDAAAVVAAISDPSFDPTAARQQYGVAVIGWEGQADAAAFTGGETPESRGHLIGPGVAVQGNVLLNDQVLKASFAAYQDAEARGLNLADRLLLALEAGSRAGGDARCGAKTAQSAYLGVAAPSDPANKPGLRIVVATDRDDPGNPIREIRRRYEAAQ